MVSLAHSLSRFLLVDCWQWQNKLVLLQNTSYETTALSFASDNLSDFIVIIHYSINCASKQAPKGHGSDWMPPKYLLAFLLDFLLACTLACVLACMPVCLLACLLGCLLACLLDWLLACLPTCLPACLPTCLPTCLLACLPSHLPACLLTWPRTPLDSLECCWNSFSMFFWIISKKHRQTDGHTHAQLLDTLGSCRSQ